MTVMTPEQTDQLTPLIQAITKMVVAQVRAELALPAPPKVDDWKARRGTLVRPGVWSCLGCGVEGTQRQGMQVLPVEDGSGLTALCRDCGGPQPGTPYPHVQTYGC